MMMFPSEVEITEVGPRDGLQNEPVFVSTEQKKRLIGHLVKTGVKRIEATSFVHRKAVPQMADAEEIALYCNTLGIHYIALTPNLKALKRAIECYVPQIAVFVGASETFNQKNIRQTVQESLDECTKVFAIAKEHNLLIRAYVSMGFSCPFEGAVQFEQVQRIVEHFVNLGADEISIGDTNGRATPRTVYERFSKLKDLYPFTSFVAHFHDTNGFAYANVMAALQASVTKFDSSIAGLGGCPFSPGATGNISTEGLVKLFHEMDIKTGIHETALHDASQFAKQILYEL